MSVRFNQNVEAMTVTRRLSAATRQLSRVSERLSSGLRINRASDDAAGLAIASALNVDSRLYAQAHRNLTDGISLLNIAEGALESLTAITIRITELAEQSANGVYTAAQRLPLNNEAQQLADEYERIIRTSEFNGTAIFGSGNRQLQVGITGRPESALSLSGVSEGIGSTAGDGTFDPAISYATLGRITSLAAGDFNNDGYDDVVSQSDSGSGTALLLGGAAGLSAPITLTTQSGSNPQAGDVNNDGNLDLFIEIFPSQSIYLGNGDGSFIPIAGGPQYSGQNFLDDFNGDGNLDIVSALEATNVVYFQRGNGNGTFAAAVSLAVPASPLSAVFGSGDTDGDGVKELITGNGVSVSIVDFAGGSPAIAATIGIATGSARRVSSGDVNSDGRADLFYGGTGGAFVRLAAGANTFDPAIQVSSRDVGGELFDFDNDGDDDLVMFEEFGIDSAVYLRLSNGDGSFAAEVSQTLTARFDVGFADINGDGAKDILVTNYEGGTVSVLNGNPVSSFRLAPFTLGTKQGSLEALDLLKEQRQNLAGNAGSIGALQSRLIAAQSGLQTANENTVAAASRIKDMDAAAETAEYVRLQILQQAGSAILASAAQQPELALRLLS